MKGASDWADMHEDMLPLREFFYPYELDVWARQQGIPPMVVLPDGWAPSLAPSIESLVSGMRQGVGLMVGAEDHFDLRWLGDGAKTMTRLQCSGNWIGYPGLEKLQEMVALRVLRAPGTNVVIDLSHLPVLEEVALRGNGLVSAVGAPRVVRVALDSAGGVNTRVPIEWLTDKITHLALSGGVNDLGFARQLSRLKMLRVERAAALDIAPLGDLQELEELTFHDVRRIRGVRALSGCASLRSVSLIRATDIDDPWALLELPLEELEASGAAFDADFASAAESRHRRWRVSASARRAPSKQSSPIEMLRTEDGLYELKFDDFDRYDALGVDAEPALSEDIDSLWSWYLGSKAPELRGLVFDSESDAVYVICPDASTAARTKQLLDALTLEPGRLERVVEQWRQSDRAQQ